MRLTKTFLKYFALALVGISLAFAVVSTGASYVVVKELTRIEEPNSKAQTIPATKASQATLPDNLSADDSSEKPMDPNLTEIMNIGHNYSAEFSVFENLLGNILQKPVPDFCSVLCNPSTLDRERLKTERSSYLVEFYRQEGRRALEDPVFRLKLEEMSSLARLFPKPLREVLAQVEQIRKGEALAPSKFALSVELEIVVARQIFSLASRVDSFQQEVESFREVRSLIDRCKQGESHQEIQSHCQALIKN